MSGRGEVIERHRDRLRKKLGRLDGFKLRPHGHHLDIELSCLRFMIEASEKGPRKEYLLDHACRIRVYQTFNQTKLDTIKLLKELDKTWGGQLDISLS